MGILVGTIAGLFGGIVDAILMRFVDVLSSIPWMVLVTVVSILLKPGITSIILVIGLFSWMEIARLVRAETQAIRGHDFVQYAELCGRCVHYHLTGGETLESVSLQKSFRDEVADFLADPAFLLCGASYLINLAFVTQVDKSFLYMKDGTRVPLPRKNAPQIRTAWVEFWLGGGAS